MGDTFNLYCDESCHLEHDSINIMALGAVRCETAVVQEVNCRIREIKARYGIPAGMEVK
jgi:hypothetical protein